MANRRLLVTGVVLLTALLPALWNAGHLALGLDAALCVLLYFLKLRGRTVAWRAWESAMQSALARSGGLRQQPASTLSAS